MKKSKLRIPAHKDSKSKERASDRRLAAALARGRKIRKKLQEAEGGSISLAEAAARLRIPAGTVLRWYHGGKIIGWRESKNAVRFPVWQFQGGKVLPGLADVIVLANKGWDCLSDYGRMLFVLSHLGSLQGRRPLDLLREGDVERVKQAVLDYIWH